MYLKLQYNHKQQSKYTYEKKNTLWILPVVYYFWKAIVILNCTIVYHLKAGYNCTQLLQEIDGYYSA